VDSPVKEAAEKRGKARIYAEKEKISRTQISQISQIF